jgi:hypothetical protein
MVINKVEEENFYPSLFLTSNNVVRFRYWTSSSFSRWPHTYIICSAFAGRVLKSRRPWGCLFLPAPRCAPFFSACFRVDITCRVENQEKQTKNMRSCRVLDDEDWGGIEWAFMKNRSYMLQQGTLSANNANDAHTHTTKCVLVWRTIFIEDTWGKCCTPHISNIVRPRLPSHLVPDVASHAVCTQNTCRANGIVDTNSTRVVG